MYTKKIKYTNFNGEEKEKKFYFNLNKAELLEMELKTPGGYEAYAQRIINSENQEELVKVFKELILLTYGEKSDDGETFYKSDELREKFQCTEAFSELFTELATNAEAATAFFNGVIPAALRADVNKELERRKAEEAKTE